MIGNVEYPLHGVDLKNGTSMKMPPYYSHHSNFKLEYVFRDILI